jgi:hypothetical protein
MSKAELQQEAREKLGFTEGELYGETVLSLRERLRRQKSAVEAVEDPFEKVPKGLERLLHSELLQECIARGLDPTGENGKPMTRPQMILLIREDVAERSAYSQSSRSSMSTRRTSVPGGRSGLRAPPEEDEDWSMELQPSATSAAAAAVRSRR